MGLYRRKGSPFFWMSFKVGGQRIYESTGTDVKKLADKIYAKRIVEVTERRWFPSEAGRRAFKELQERYMRDHSRVYKTEKSAVRDECSFKHLSAFLGRLTLADITPSRISEYKAIRRREGAKPATLARELEVLRHAFNLAVREWEWVDRNPFERIKIDRCDNRKERWITLDEEAALVSACLPWVQEVVIFALNTGARQDEILSLKWSEVDLSRRTATFLKTKNKEKRTVPLNQTLLALLKNKDKVRSISGHVFISQSGTKIDARNLLRAFYVARKKAELEDVRFHDLRHTFATRLVQAGINLYVVRELLGHKSLAMTMRYAHHYPESLRHGVEVLDQMCDTGVTLKEKRG